MAGTVYKDGNGGWISQVQVGFYPNGRPKYRRFKASTKKEAMQKLDKYVYETKNLSVLSPNDASVLTGDYVEQYLTLYKVNTLKASSYTRDLGILNKQIKPCIGGVPLKSLDAATIQHSLINNLVASGYSWSTIHKAYTLLKEALNKAVQEDLVYKNVCNSVTMPSKTVLKPKTIEVLTEEEIKLFIRTAYSSKYSFGRAILLVLYTGLRCGELCALKWSDIDFESKVLTVQRNVSVSEVDGKRTIKLQEGTKTQLSRKIPLNDDAIALLNLIKAENGEAYCTSDSFIIKTRSAIPDISIISKTYNNMLRYSSITGRTGIHTLRHTFASELLKRGVDIKVVSEILGHSSVSFTYNTYIHLTLEQKSDALSVLHF